MTNQGMYIVEENNEPYVWVSLRPSEIKALLVFAEVSEDDEDLVSHPVPISRITQIKSLTKVYGG